MNMPPLSKVREALFGDRAVWNMTIYVTDEPFSIDFDLKQPRKIFSSSHPKLFGLHPHTRADPFLFVDGGYLYLFFEIVFPRQQGKICAYRTKDLQHFEYLGEILHEKHHLSFPFVFRGDDERQIFMLPKSSGSGIVALYQFLDFPRGLTKIRELLSGVYYDSFLVKRRSTWFLFTTSAKGLEIFYSEDLLEGVFAPNPLNPVNSDSRYSRSAGGPLSVAGAMYRVAQDCSGTYGRNIHIFRIDELTPSRYRETLVRENAIDLSDLWRSLGSHHISVALFLNKNVIATDGKENDFFLNRYFSLLSSVIYR